MGYLVVCSYQGFFTFHYGLIKTKLKLQTRVEMWPLHSTMVLLKLPVPNTIRLGNSSFTFHYGLIKTIGMPASTATRYLLYIPLWSY